MATTAQVVLKGPNEGRSIEVLTPDALAFVARLQRQFGNRRVELLRQRDERQARLDAGEAPQFLADTETVRGSEWRVAKAPRDLEDRRGENPRPTHPQKPINPLHPRGRRFLAGLPKPKPPPRSDPP